MLVSNMIYANIKSRVLNFAPCRVNPPTGSSNLRILLHHVHSFLDGLWLEIYISVQRQTECPSGSILLLVLSEVCSVSYLVSQEVVHVHDLRPALLMTDLLLVLQMANNLGFVWKSPGQTTTVGGADLLRGLHLVLAVPLLAVVVHGVDQVNHVVIDTVLALQTYYENEINK